jgi:hypothetical protein
MRAIAQYFEAAEVGLRFQRSGFLLDIIKKIKQRLRLASKSRMLLTLALCSVCAGGASRPAQTNGLKTKTALGVALSLTQHYSFFFIVFLFF